MASPVPEKHQSPRHLAFIWKWNRPAMERGGRVLGPARTNFNDYVGTVAADDTEAVLDRPSLYGLAHIDRDRYTIVAIDLIVDGPVAATIYAVDRVEQGISLRAEIVEVGQYHGEIPGLQFDLAEPGVEEFIRKAFKRISVRLVAQHLRDQVLVVAKSSSTESDGPDSAPNLLVLQ